MRFNFIGTESSIELPFSCFTANNSLDVREVTAFRNSSIVMLEKSNTSSIAHPLVNARTERPQQL